MEESIIEVVEESIKDLDEVTNALPVKKFLELVAIAEKLDAQYKAALDKWNNATSDYTEVIKLSRVARIAAHEVATAARVVVCKTAKIANNAKVAVDNAKVAAQKCTDIF